MNRKWQGVMFKRYLTWINIHIRILLPSPGELRVLKILLFVRCMKLMMLNMREGSRSDVSYDDISGSFYNIYYLLLKIFERVLEIRCRMSRYDILHPVSYTSPWELRYLIPWHLTSSPPQKFFRRRGVYVVECQGMKDIWPEWRFILDMAFLHLMNDQVGYTLTFYIFSPSKIFRRRRVYVVECQGMKDI